MHNVIILFIIALFVSGFVVNIRDETVIGFLFLILAAALSFSFVTQILMRRKVQVFEEKERQAEAVVQNDTSEENRRTYNDLKQRMLEDMIVSEVENHWPEAKILKNVLIPKSKGEPTEIDVLVLLETGVFVIEAKNLNAQIEGSWKDHELDAYYPNNDKHVIYNPVKQNENHCTYLKNILGVNAECMRNIVVFGTFTRFTFQDVPFNTQICKLQGVVKAMERLSKRMPCKLEKHQIDKWFQNLEEASASIKDRK